MVLSKKKLKQNHRAELTLNPESNVSLKLHTSTNKPILSKRDKLRKIRPLQQTKSLPSQQPNEDEGTKNNKEIWDEGLGKKNIKKRKRKVENENGDDVVKEVVVKDPKQSKKKMKLKQKKKHEQKKKRRAKAAEERAKTAEEKAKTAEEKAKTAVGYGSNYQEEMPQSIGFTNTNTNTSQDDGVVATKVYVGGIPFYSTEDDIRSYFEGCGTITVINCMTFSDTGKFRGIAIISFKTEAAAKRALALDGSDMGGLFLKIQPYKATQATRFTPEMKEGYNRIYVGSLSWEITEEELKKFFSNCNIQSIRLGKDKETGEFRGYAHVDFSDSQSLKTALELDQSVLFGRPVRISCAVPLKKQPDAGEKSIIGSKLGAGKKSVPGSKPGVGKQSVAGSKPCAGERSVTGEKIGAGKNSVAGGKPDAGEISVADKKPGLEEKPIVEKPGSVVSGKRKNRMCYGCRQKGHNLSECPNQQIVTSTTI